MADETDSTRNRQTDIPVLDVMADVINEPGPAEDGGLPNDDEVAALLPLVERIAARVDRELEQEFERLVSAPVQAALTDALANYQRQVRVILLRTLLEQLGQDNQSTSSR